LAHEVCVERQPDNVDGEDEHHDIDLDVFQCHPQTTVCAQVFGVNIGNAHIFGHAQLGDFEFFLGEASSVVRKVGEDESGGNSNSHRSGALDPEKPLPGRVSKNSIHVAEHSCCDEGREGVGDEVAAEKDGVPLGELTTCVPFREDLLGHCQYC
jgi:hypothetical protein